MTTALRALEQAIEAPRTDGTASESVSVGNWRWTVRQRMAAVRDVLSGEVGDPEDGWLAARGGRAFRERNTLLGRMSALGPQVLESPDVERVRSELKRLVADIARHMQRLNDLVYDDVEIELGGSE
ncbi:MAG TPA: hypothetical protein VFO49_08785 [Nocardioides sp.]|nr:hypothetical protein [Nocardioides sp.]